VRQGRFDEAEQLLDGLSGDSDAARPLAAVQLAQGKTALARDTLERALDPMDPLDSAAVPLLLLLIDVHLARDEFSDADATAQRLERCSASHASEFLSASAALGRGRVCLATNAGDPQACLREALAGFGRAQMPIEVAHARLELANALLTDRPEVAMAEARAALEAYERLHAARDVDAAAAVLRSLGARPATGGKGAGPLTKRESEVLDLLGHGLTNAEISDRLFISRKTVEHHVGNVLAKLGLRSRAEAAAYVTKSKPGVE
jgi:DNA-binding CsgD family transcriptional regulator